MSKFSNNISPHENDLSANAKIPSSLPNGSEEQKKEDNPKILDIQFKKRFSQNILTNILYFILNIIVGLVMVPFFLDSLGQSAYGLVPLATSVTSYFILIINALNTIISRYLTIELQKNNVELANSTFNTAIFGSLCTILACSPIIFGLAFLTPVFFNIGESAASDVILLFVFVFLAALIRTWNSNFLVTLFAYNRLDQQNYVNIINLAVQLGSVILIFSVFGPSLPGIGISYVIAAGVSLVVSFILSRRLCPFLSINPRLFSWRKFKEIGGKAIWIVFNDLGLFVRLQIALTLVNIWFGTVAGTEYSLVIVWSSLIVSIGSLITTTFIPQIYLYRAKEDSKTMIRFSATAMRITGYGIALVLGLVCVFSAQLFTVWVGEEYAKLYPLVWFVVIPTYFTILASIGSIVYTSYLKVAIPTIMNLITGGLTILLAYIFAILLNMGVYGVALGTGIAIFIYSVAFGMIYAAHVANAPFLSLIKPMVPGFLSFIVFSFFGCLYTHIITVDSLFMLIISGLLFTCAYVTVMLFVVIRKDDKKEIRSCLPAILKEKIPKWLL